MRFLTNWREEIKIIFALVSFSSSIVDSHIETFPLPFLGSTARPGPLSSWEFHQHPAPAFHPHTHNHLRAYRSYFLSGVKTSHICIFIGGGWWMGWLIESTDVDPDPHWLGFGSPGSEIVLEIRIRSRFKGIYPNKPDFQPFKRDFVTLYERLRSIPTYIFMLKLNFCDSKVGPGSESAGIRISLTPWIRIRIEVRNWIRIHIETNAGEGTGVVQRVYGLRVSFFIVARVLKMQKVGF
jgi:hypothetical protein